MAYTAQTNQVMFERLKNFAVAMQNAREEAGLQTARDGWLLPFVNQTPETMKGPNQCLESSTA